MAEAIVQEATPKKVAFMSKPKNIEERIKKDEKELEKLLQGQKEEAKEEAESKEETSDNKEPESAEERSFKKRYGDLRKHQQQQQKAFEDKITNLERQLGEATKKEIKLPKTEEELETWAKEYPDVAAIVESIAIKKAREQSKGIEDKIKKYEDLRVEASKEKAEAELLSIHPDFEQIRETDDFHDLYKADKNIINQKPSKDAAKAVNAKGQRSEPQSNDSKSYIKESDVQAMSAEEYEKKADTIMEAIRSGKFIYDLSGSAR
jgi:hypothetical protein